MVKRKIMIPPIRTIPIFLYANYCRHLAPRTDQRLKVLTIAKAIVAEEALRHKVRPGEDFIFIEYYYGITINHLFLATKSERSW